MLKRDEIKKVLDGDSAIGTLNPYFIDTPTFNKKHGIEDDTGYGQANGYGVVSNRQGSPQLDSSFDIR